MLKKNKNSSCMISIEAWKANEAFYQKVIGTLNKNHLEERAAADKLISSYQKALELYKEENYLLKKKIIQLEKELKGT